MEPWHEVVASLEVDARRGTFLRPVPAGSATVVWADPAATPPIAEASPVEVGDRSARDPLTGLACRASLLSLLQGALDIPVESAPFAVCDASTVKREDLFDSEVVGGLGDFNRRSLWGFNLAYHPGHRWYWVPHMCPWEVLVFKLFDSDPDAVQHTAHSAFEDPDTPPDAAPRQSIEVRTIAYL